MKEKLKWKDEYELENMGGYDRIYPVEDNESR